jgi:DNA-binding transcriptional LysR family regulator
MTDVRDINLNALFVFTVLGRSASLAAAARELGTQKSTVSRQLAELESALGVRLVQRTSRQWALTDAGALFLRESQAVIDAARAALGSVAAHHDEPTGLLRVTCPVTFGQHFLGPVLVRYLDEHPNVQVSVALTDRSVELVDESVDVAIRIGPLTDSSLVVRRIATLDPVCCAAPRYLASRGTPATPRALSEHDCIVWNGRTPSGRWLFRSTEQPLEVAVTGRASADDPALQAQLAEAGFGIALLPRFIAADALARGRLVELFAGSTIAFSDLVALYPSGQLLAPKVRAFVDLLAAVLGGRLSAAPRDHAR